MHITGSKTIVELQSERLWEIQWLAGDILTGTVSNIFYTRFVRFDKSDVCYPVR